MKRRLWLLVLLVVGTTSHAELGLIVLARNKPVFDFVQATDAAEFQCKLIAHSYWDQAGSGSDPGGKLAEIQSCVGRAADAPKEKLIVALKYLEGKPGSSKALKDFYLKWVSSLQSMMPTVGESFRANSARSARAENALTESRKALELELELGT